MNQLIHSFPRYLRTRNKPTSITEPSCQGLRPFRSHKNREGVNQPVGTTTHPERSAEGRNRPRPRRHPSAYGPLTSEDQAEWARLIEQRHRHGRRTDRKASVGPGIDRNSCGSDNTHIREQDIGIQPVRHSSGRSLQLSRWGRTFGGR